MKQDLVRLIKLQFSFSNPKAVPESVKRLERETSQEQKVRKMSSGGVCVIDPTENCSLSKFVGEVEDSGYELVGAIYKPRIDTRDVSGRSTYHMVRFTFAHTEFVELSKEFKKIRDAIHTDLETMTTTSLWRVRAFLNPFYEEDEVVDGQFSASINLEARKPLFHPDGRPVAVWQKDGNGERLGDAPILITPNYQLRLVDGLVSLIDN